MNTALEDRVRANYGGGGTLDRILGLVAAAEGDPDRPTVEALQSFDALHLGGARVSALIARDLPLPEVARVLDIGSGLGGMARMLATTRGAAVEGIDLSPEFVAVATELSRRAGLAGVAFREASALALPFPAAAFDAATMLHVGMNLADKPRLFAEVARVLRPGGAFAVYDVMRTGPGEPDYPLPWAGTPDISYLESPDDYASHARVAGLAELSRREHRDVALRFLHALAANPGRGMPADRRENVRAAVTAGILTPVEMIFRKPDGYAE